MDIQDIWNLKRSGKLIEPQECQRCGKMCKAAAIRTLFADEPLCLPCAQKLHRNSKGKLPTTQTGTVVTGASGKRHRK